ncbi:TPA: DUF6261 family protein [Streptococcus suis]
MTAKKENHSASNTSIQISKVKPLPLQKLDNINFYQLNSRSLKTLEQSQIPFSQDNHLTLAIDKWHVAFSQYKKAINQDKGKELTKKIQDANQLRNSDFSIFKRSLSAFETSRRQAEMTAYSELSQIVKPFREIHRLDYEKESLELDKLFNRLSTSEAVEHIETLGLKRFFENLKESQQEFETVFSNTTDIRSKANRYDTYQIRKELQSAYLRVLKLCEILMELHGQSLYSELIILFNTSRQYYIEQLSHHSNKVGKNDKSIILQLPEPSPQS